jgi:hypothetical protein
MPIMKDTLVLAAMAAMTAAMTLAGCGSSSGDGGGIGAPAQTTGVPDSAQRSASGLLAYMNQLIAGTDETSEPVFLGDATLPADDATDSSL